MKTLTSKENCQFEVTSEECRRNRMVRPERSGVQGQWFWKLLNTLVEYEGLARKQITGHHSSKVIQRMWRCVPSRWIYYRNNTVIMFWRYTGHMWETSATGRLEKRERDNGRGGHSVERTRWKNATRESLRMMHRSSPSFVFVFMWFLPLVLTSYTHPWFPVFPAMVAKMVFQKAYLSVLTQHKLLILLVPGVLLAAASLLWLSLRMLRFLFLQLAAGFSESVLATIAHHVSTFHTTLHTLLSFLLLAFLGRTRFPVFLIALPFSRGKPRPIWLIF